MLHPLDGAKLKIVRAEEHLNAFKAEERAFLDTNPYSFESQVYLDYWWARPILTAQPPSPISATIGDCVTNCRAALDYILWALAVRYLKPPPDISSYEDRRITAFPIARESRTDKGYQNRIHVLTKRHIPAAALREIDSVQPDVCGDDTLWWLHELVNHDKHRTPILTVGAFSSAHIEIHNFRGEDHTFEVTATNEGIAFQTAEELISAIRHRKVNVNVQASVHITCHDVPMPALPLTRTLEQIIERVADTIPRFEPFF